MPSIKNTLFYRLVKFRDRSMDLYQKLTGNLKEGDTILDIGSGGCVTVEFLREEGFEVTPLDIVNLSMVDGIAPNIYDGRRIPFKDKSFDVALLLWVLHHVEEPEALLLEAKRVARRVIIIEDVYDARWQQLLTYAMDSVVNIEYFGHPHTNKNDQQWQQTFNTLGLHQLAHHTFPFWILFKGAFYHLSTSKT